MELSNAITSGFRLTSLDETLVLFVSVIVFTCLFLCGRAVCGSKSPKAIWAPTGILLAYTIFLLGSNIWVNFSILIPFTIICLTALVGMLVERHTLASDLEKFFLAILFVFPLCWLANINNNPFWDDFTNWLPPARYLSEFGHLPTIENPDLTRTTQNYPFARALFHSWVSKITSGFSLNVQGILNVLFASSFLLWADTLLRNANPNLISRKRQILFLSFMGLLSGLLVIWVVTLNTRMIVTSYADPTFSIFIANIFFYFCFVYSKDNNFARGKVDPNIMLLFALPVIVKGTGLVFSIFLFGSFWLVNSPFFKPDLNAGYRTFFRTTFYQLLHFLPAIFVAFVWWLYCKKHDLSAPLSVQNLDSWNFSTTLLTLDAIWGQLLGRPYMLLGSMIIAWILFSKSAKDFEIQKDKMLLKAAVLFALSMILFHFFCYVAVFSEAEAVRAASFSRYIAPCGFIIWIGITIFWIKSLVKYNYKKILWAGSISSIIFVTATISQAEKIVVPGTQTPLIAAAKFIEKNFNDRDNILIVDFLTSGIDSVSIKFYLSPDVSAKTSYVAWKPDGVSVEELTTLLKRYDAVYVHSARQYERDVIKQMFEEKIRVK